MMDGGCAAAVQLFHAQTAEGVPHAGVSEVIVRCEQGAHKWAQCRHPTAHTFFSHIWDEKAAAKCHIATAVHADMELLSRGSVVGVRCLDASTSERCFTDLGGCGHMAQPWPPPHRSGRCCPVQHAGTGFKRSWVPSSLDALLQRRSHRLPREGHAQIVEHVCFDARSLVG